MHRLTLKARLTLALALVASLAAQARPALADDFALEDSHTAVVFSIGHMGLSITYGRFNKVKGTFTLDAADPAASKFQLAIETASVDTNNAQRDGHLKNADFFNAEEFPVISFESTKVATRQDGDKTVYDVTGNFTMHGVTKEITLPLVKLGEGEGMGGYRAGFACETTLNRSDYGMTKFIPADGQPGVTDEVKILISFEGLKQ